MCPRLDVIIIAGNFNSKIGKEAIYLPTIGKHSLRNVCNDDGHRLINFCASHNPVVCSSIFPHKGIYLGTWTSSDGNTVNQIDDFLISARHRSNLLDVRTFPKVRARIPIVKTRRRQRCKKFNL